MEKFFHIINTNLSFKLLFGLLQLHLFYINIQCIEYNKRKISNIILFEQDFQYLSFANYSNGDMIFSSTAYPENKKRIFYGFKKNGRPFFQKETKYFYSISSTNKKKFESDTLVIKLSGENQKEYLLSTGNKESLVEIYDFENNNIYTKSMYNFAKNNVVSLRNMGIFLYSDNNSNYYLFGFIIKGVDNLKYSLQIHNFSTIENFNNSETFNNSTEIDNSYKDENGISCFITENQIIMCFYLNLTYKCTFKGWPSCPIKYYNIIAYNIKLKSIGNNFKLDDDNYFEYDYSFYRCIHLKGEVGIFSYYKQSSLILSFKKFNQEIIDYSISQINLNYYPLDTYLLTNDIIKLKEDKICFSSISSIYNNYIYIILINLFDDDKKYIVRYYSIYLENKIYTDIRTHNYNNFVSFAFSYYYNNGNKYYSGLMLFSYPNSTDNSSDLYEFLINNYNSTINDFNVSLENDVRIENNIFEYDFYGIIIQNISNCLNPQLITSLNNSIKSNTSLLKDELIKLKFSDNNYTYFNCNIKYIPVLIEPDLDKDYKNIQYPIYQVGPSRTSSFNFEKEKFYGRLTYYNIYLSESLSDNCNFANCLLCLDRNKSSCITYKNNFTVETSTKEEKNSNEYINNDTVYFTEETENTNLTYEYRTDEKDSDITNTTDVIKTEDKKDIGTEAFKTQEQKVKNDIDTNKLDKDTDIFESTNIKKEETNKIDNDIDTNKDTDKVPNKNTDTVINKDTDIITNKDTDTTTETQIIIK